ncbi:hypothetical protein RHO12_11540 [Orbus sturtevantii]|uniref:hypothetical protein n=1 Tax=Orbus sturtevantii TaxID=3074109 RepID=UPI00370D23E2
MKVFIFVFVFLSSFFIYANNFDGSYSLSNKDDCNKMLSIDIKNNFFSIYSMNNNLENKKLIIKGKLEILNNGTNIYLKMNAIEALYYKNTIVIQNSGNSMNNYTYFDLCDSKYLNFNKLLK